VGAENLLANLKIEHTNGTVSILLETTIMTPPFQVDLKDIREKLEKRTESDYPHEWISVGGSPFLKNEARVFNSYNYRVPAKLCSPSSATKWETTFHRTIELSEIKDMLTNPVVENFVRTVIHHNKTLDHDFCEIDFADEDFPPVKTKKRAYRRWKRYVKISKRLTYSFGDTYRKSGRGGILSKTVNPCSCQACGNKRPYEGLSIAEKRVVVNFWEQLEEFGLKRTTIPLMRHAYGHSSGRSNI